MIKVESDFQDEKLDLVAANQYWSRQGYEVLLTGDQSPTLRPLSRGGILTDAEGEKFPPETMHHRGGAFSETQLIYGEALREAVGDFYSTRRLLSEASENGRFSVLSVGLGLGYNEILLAFECLKRSIQPHDVYMESFEKDRNLVAAFVDFFEKNLDPSGVYRNICEFFLDAHSAQRGIEVFPDLSIIDIQSWLLECFRSAQLKLRESLQPEVKFENRFSLIFYDAFSSKTNPELWEEVFLTDLWKSISASRCIVSTYACTGALKRSLKNNNFELQIKEGFLSKRDRTYAVKKES